MELEQEDEIEKEESTMNVRPRTISATEFLLWLQIVLGIIPFAINLVAVDWTAMNEADGSGTASRVQLVVIVVAALGTAAVLFVPIILIRRFSRWAILAVTLVAAWGVWIALQRVDIFVYVSALVGLVTVLLICLPVSRGYLRNNRPRAIVGRQESRAFSRRLPRSG